MKRDEAIALLRQIAENKRLAFNWISLVNRKSGCEIHIKPEQGSSAAALEQNFDKRGLNLKETKGTLVIYREH